MNGIASYANQEMVPPGAIANIRGAADMLERFGREGDIYVVHAAEGETVVPMEVLDSSPNLKKMLFSQMEEMGLKPERYVVGNELNSLNPVTGRPEFFFKKLFKSIKGIFKKAAPILGAIAGTFLAPGIGTAFGAMLGGSATAVAIGSVAGSALASGIGSFAASKLTGASTDNALKGAAFAAGTAGIFKGFTEFTNIGDTFSSGLDDFFSGEPLSEAASSIGMPGVQVPALQTSYSAPVPTMFTDGATGTEQMIGGGLGVASGPAPSLAGKMGFSVSDIAGANELSALEPGLGLTADASLGRPLPNLQVGLDPIPRPIPRPALLGKGAPADTLNVPYGEEFMKTSQNLSGSSGGQRTLVGGGETDLLPPERSYVDEFKFTQQPMRPPSVIDQLGPGREAVQTGTVKINSFQPDSLDKPPVAALADRSFIDSAFDAVRDYDYAGIPDEIMQGIKENKLSTALALGGAGIAAFDAYQTNEELEEEAEKRKKANNLFAQAFRVGAPINLGQNPDFRRPVFAKKGGGIPSKGLGDVVPAMLEPGEFVMTRNAVAGAGNGSQKNGIKRMYSMMKDFERRV
jgi:hypothetical protein